ncbi:MAG: undecaprenyldiphospho-muramoylpentapeptide beta-N-acetylglucosaminyltransferase [Bacteroidales bacterium]|nr:undecaprenyldiphospho-muramoylpentapeptide beta-N-acetylglucosaminyltransferase [Bacteroidales bacterium]
MKVIISGGGTGGHIFPAIAIANVIQKHQSDSDILFIGASGRMEMQKVPQAGYKIEGLNIKGFQRKKIWKNLSLPIKMISSLLKAKQIIKEFRPDIVIGVGGYASWATLFAAQKLGIPTLIQEQNSLAGKTNQILAKKASAICVAYGNMDKYFPEDKIIFTGNPVRNNIASFNDNTNGERTESLQHFDLKEGMKTLFVTGGSLGAGSINKVIDENLQYFIDNNIQLLWQTGKSYYSHIIDSVSTLFKHSPKAKELIHIHEFITDMDKAYRVADVIMARAGALSISELCLVGKPLILVPSPNVAEDHQTKNATALVNRNAALMIKDTELDSLFVNVLDGLIKDEIKMKTLGKNIIQLGIRDADERIFKVINELVK